jgi:hypothetical protein
VKAQSRGRSQIRGHLRWGCDRGAERLTRSVAAAVERSDDLAALDDDGGEGGLLGLRDGGG